MNPICGGSSPVLEQYTPLKSVKMSSSLVVGVVAAEREDGMWISGSFGLEEELKKEDDGDGDGGTGWRGVERAWRLTGGEVVGCNCVVADTGTHDGQGVRRQ
jgi:hypothetical protein